jgi:hypothetical protein
MQGKDRQVAQKREKDKCAECTSTPHLTCCGRFFCLIHAHGSHHAQHSSLWQISNAAEHSLALPSFNKRRDVILSSLEAELEDLEHKANLDKQSRKSSSEPPSKLLKVTPTGNEPSMAAVFSAPFAKSRNPTGGLTFAELKQRTKLEAAKKKSADMEKRSSGSAVKLEEPPPVTENDNSIVVIDDDEDDDVDSTARSKLSIKSSIWSHDFKKKKVAASPDPPVQAKILADLKKNQHSTGDDPIEILDSVESISTVRNSVLRAISDALRDGARLDVVSVAAAGVDTSSEIVYRAALERAEALLPKAAALLAVSKGIEGALYSAMNADVSLSLISTSQTSKTEAEPQDSRTGQLYRDRARELVTALRNAENKDLRASILSGEVMPSNFVRFSSLELAAPTHRAEIQRLKLVALRDSTLEGDGKGIYGPASSSTISCPNCNSKVNILSRNISLARDIRKAEIWGTSGEETLFGLLCSTCRHSWVSSEG